MLKIVDLLQLKNRKLCTIDLAKRTLSSERYGLAYLNEKFHLYPHANHHRALSDALTTTYLFKRILDSLPASVKSVEDLIRFSKEGALLQHPVNKSEES